MSGSKICVINNIAPHYREAIFKLMDKEFKCDFYIGDRISSEIKLMDYEILDGFSRKLKNVKCVGKFYWQKGVVQLSFKSYKLFIVDGEPYCLSNWWLLLSNKIIGKKSFIWSHGWYGNETVVKRFTKKLFFSLGNKVLLYGEYARNLMIQRGFPEKKLICIYNSLNYDQQLLIRGKLGNSMVFKRHFDNDDPVVIFLGRLQINKKLDLLISALEHLGKNSIKCNLVLIGENVDGYNIENVIGKSSIKERVWNVGALYDEEKLANYIFNADVCVSPGNVGLTAIHAMTYGTPVITHDNFPNQMPEFEIITANITGSFFKENSIIDLSEKINYWISIPKQIRAETRLACYKVIDLKYNPHYQISILKGLIQDILF